MKIGIIGGGSIGLLLGSYLSEIHDVTIYVRRPEQKRVLNESGLTVTGTDKKRNVKAMMIGDMKQEECLLICVKQPHVPQVIPIINTTNNNTPLFFLQNGMGHIELMKKMGQPLYIGVVEHGAYREKDNKVNHLGLGRIRLAVFDGRKQELVSIVNELNQTNFPFERNDNWQELLTDKLVINAVINPLTALFNVNNGMILRNPYLKELAKELCKEASVVLMLDVEEQWQRVKTVATNTDQNISSMLNDVRRGDETEIDAISGYLLKQSTSTIPFTSFVYNGIKALESKE